MTRKTGIRWNRIIDPVVADESGIAAADVSGIIQDTVPSIVADSIVAGSGISVEAVDSTVTVSSTVSIPQRVERLEGLIDGVPSDEPGITYIKITDTTPGSLIAFGVNNSNSPIEIDYEIQEGDTALTIAQNLMDLVDEQIYTSMATPYNQYEAYTDYEALVSGHTFRLISMPSEDGKYFFAPYADYYEGPVEITSVMGKAAGVGVIGNMNVTNGGLYGVQRIYDSTNIVKLFEFESGSVVNLADGSLQIFWPGGGILGKDSITANGRMTSYSYFRGKAAVLDGNLAATVNGAVDKIVPTNATAWGNVEGTIVKVTSNGTAIASGLQMEVHNNEGRLAVVHNEGPSALTIDCLDPTGSYHSVVTPSGNNIVLEPGDNLFVIKNNNPEQWLPIGGSYHTNRKNHYGPMVPTKMTVAERDARTDMIEGEIIYTTDNHKSAYYNGTTWIEY